MPICYWVLTSRQFQRAPILQTFPITSPGGRPARTSGRVPSRRTPAGGPQARNVPRRRPNDCPNDCPASPSASVWAAAGPRACQPLIVATQMIKCGALSIPHPLALHATIPAVLWQTNTKKPILVFQDVYVDFIRL